VTIEMATTQAQAAVMEQTAAKFDQVNESLQSTLKRLLGELEVLRTQWQGAGGASFEQVKLAWAADQEALQRALGETATAIRTSGRQYQATDTVAADRLWRSPARRHSTSALTLGEGRLMGGGDVLVVNFAALQQASADIQSALSALETQLGQLERDAAPLVVSWDGAARQAYDTRQARWRQAADDLSRILRDIKRALDESAVDYQNTEKRNTNLFQ
jgi:WXG100 family type VII secretion target